MPPRIAIVHDFLYTYGGAERVLEQMLQCFPDADVFALFDFLPDQARGFLGGRSVTTTFLQRMPMCRRYHRHMLPLMPLAVEQLDMTGYDLVLSSSYIAAKGVITGPDQFHLCYCHTPPRYAWDLQHQYLTEAGLNGGGFGPRSMLARWILHYIRNWDARSANGVDQFIANSNFIARRIQKVYRRDAEVIHPPVDTDRFALCEDKEDYYLTAARLVPYKRVDLIIDAFAQMPDKELRVVGDGPEFKRLAARATPNVKMLGYQGDDAYVNLMQRAKAFVYAAQEDFGIVMVEAQACGTPVLAYRRGGAEDIVVPGDTGLLYDEQTPEDIVAAVHDAEATPFDPVALHEHASQFSAAHFRDALTDLAAAGVATDHGKPLTLRRALPATHSAPTIAGARA